MLDNGFEQRLGLSERLGSKLHVVKEYPVEFLEKYNLEPNKRANRLARTAHGTGMAMIIEGLLENNRAATPDIFLLNANGITNFRRAVFYALDKDVDVILYAQNWEFGGNYDGEGFINKIVSEITAYKAIWVNAAGNYGSMVWNGSYKKTDATDIYHEKGSRLNFEVKFDATPVTVTVAWNDFQDFENHQTQERS